jgi:hypothetical protein
MRILRHTLFLDHSPTALAGQEHSQAPVIWEKGACNLHVSTMQQPGCDDAKSYRYVVQLTAEEVATAFLKMPAAELERCFLPAELERIHRKQVAIVTRQFLPHKNEDWDDGAV